MTIVDPSKARIYHITDVSNLEAIFAEGSIISDALARKRATATTVIGYAHIKDRRLTQYRIACCGNRFVGEFVPFYFCPRSPMLYTINIGKTGRQPGCQATIVHLVSTVQNGYELNQPWAISDGNAGALYTTFANDVEALDRVNWEVVNSTDWKGERLSTKMTEFLVADRFPISALIGIGCENAGTAEMASRIVAQYFPDLPVKVIKKWYY